MLNFGGKVALVTGAGGGLGREYALLFAERGASVVVNDLGGSATGDGKSARAADQVVEEIRRKGGRAVANYDSVEEGQRLVDTAIQNYGRIDIVVNNAGILRDKSFANMTDQDWDLIHRVHLRGSFSVSRAAWPHMRKQQYGRIIMTSSNSGVYGNFGQANYSAAKMGLVGLTNTLAREGAKYSIYVNTVIPTAASRLTAPLMPEEVLNALHPRHVAPLTVWLCHDSCNENGGLFEAAAGWFGKLEYHRSNGKKLVASAGQAASPEAVQASWAQITDMTGAKHFSQSGEVTASLLDDTGMEGTFQNKMQKAAVKTGNSPLDAIGHQYPPVNGQWTQRDTQLYAHSIGASVQDLDNLRFLYENHENFSVFPTFMIVAGISSVFRNIADSSIPGVKFDPAKLLHGEQFLEIFDPTVVESTDGQVKLQTTIVDMVDKGSGAVMVTDTVGSNPTTGQKMFRCQAGAFLRGAGNYGGHRSSDKLVPIQPVPAGMPDAIVEQRVNPDQAVVYRIASGDYNPLHIDPNFSVMGGFPVPILHGMCSYGYSARHVLKTFAGNDATKFKAIKARFSGAVLPGQTLVTRMWRGTGDRVHFETFVKETGKPAISGGYMDFQQGTLAAGKPKVPKTTTPTTSTTGGLKSHAVFEALSERLRAKPELATKINAVYQWVITKDGKTVGIWTVDLKSNPGAIYTGEPKAGTKAGVTLTLDDDTMQALVAGTANAQKMFMTGKLKIKGNLMLTQKLEGLLKDEAKL